LFLNIKFALKEEIKTITKLNYRRFFFKDINLINKIKEDIKNSMMNYNHFDLIDDN